MEYDPRGGRAAPRVDARYMPDCAFFLAGKCLRGHACPFKHDPSRLAAQVTIPQPLPLGDCWPCGAQQANSSRKLT